MLTIQRNYWKDLVHAKEVIDFGTKQPTKVELYRTIASYVGVNADGLDIDTLWSAIDAKNLELACVGIAESMVDNGSTVVDEMAAKLNKPPVRPVVKYMGGLGAATMRPKDLLIKRSKAVEKPKLRVK